MLELKVSKSPTVVAYRTSILTSPFIRLDTSGSKIIQKYYFLANLFKIEEMQAAA